MTVSCHYFRLWILRNAKGWTTGSLVTTWNPSWGWVPPALCHVGRSQSRWREHGKDSCTWSLGQANTSSILCKDEFRVVFENKELTWTALSWTAPTWGSNPITLRPSLVNSGDIIICIIYEEEIILAMQECIKASMEIWVKILVVKPDMLKCYPFPSSCYL